MNNKVEEQVVVLTTDAFSMVINKLGNMPFMQVADVMKALESSVFLKKADVQDKIDAILSPPEQLKEPREEKPKAKRRVPKKV